jgi:hypothetical protein
MQETLVKQTHYSIEDACYDIADLKKEVEDLKKQNDDKNDLIASIHDILSKKVDEHTFEEVKNKLENHLRGHPPTYVRGIGWQV